MTDATTTTRPVSATEPKRSMGGAVRAVLLAAPFLALVAIALLPWSALPYDPERVAGPPALAPNSEFLFGTDSSGLDVFSRTLAATRLDLGVGILASMFVVAIAGSAGAMLGYLESRRTAAGFLARLALRVTDLVQSIPLTVAALVIVVIFGTHPVVFALGIALILSPAQTRLVRTEVLRVKSEGYVEAARVAGRSDAGIAFSRILPNSLWPLVENWPMLFANSIMIIAALGFLGVGMQPPTPEWGAMIAAGSADASAGRWWSATFPSLALVVSVVAMNLLRRLIVGWLPQHLRGG